MIAVIYFYFRLPANVKFFSDIIFTAEKDRPGRLVSIAGVIGGRHATKPRYSRPIKETRFFDKTGLERITSVVAGNNDADSWIFPVPLSNS